MKRTVSRFFLSLIALVMCATLSAGSGPKEPLPCGPVPTEEQLRWQDMEMYAFIHYSMTQFNPVAEFSHRAQRPYPSHRQHPDTKTGKS